MDFLDKRLPDRFWSKVSPCPMSGCWLWTGSACRKGYGRFRHGDRSTTPPQCAHRVAYGVLVGPIPDDLEIDHRVCNTSACVNPGHMEPVTGTVNAKRAAARQRLLRAQRGHRV